MPQLFLLKSRELDLDVYLWPPFFDFHFSEVQFNPSQTWFMKDNFEEPFMFGQIST